MIFVNGKQQLKLSAKKKNAQKIMILTSWNLVSPLFLNWRTSEIYYEALQNATSIQTPFTKRQPEETYINNYNADSTLWKANIELQYVTSPYAAIAYITSYVTKESENLEQFCMYQQRTERHKQQTATLSQMQIMYVLKKLLTEFCSFLCICPISKQYVYIRILRMGIIKARPILKALDYTNENVFCTHIIDRYYARPQQLNLRSCMKFRLI